MGHIGRSVHRCLQSFPLRASAMVALTVVLGGVNSLPTEAARAKRSRPQPPSDVVSTARLTPPLPAIVRAPAMPPVPLVAAVSLSTQTITVYSGGDVVARAPISSGMAGYDTPTGVFSIIQKAKYHESNIYDGAPMPFMQRLTWSGIALHAGKLPGYRASHGCIRLPYDFAERLFGMLRMGTRVVVANEVVSPEPIAHAALPKPLSTPVTVIAGRPVASPLTLASTTPTLAETHVETMLDPLRWAEHEKHRAARALQEAQIEAHRATMGAAEAVSAANDADEEQRRIKRDIASYHSQLERARAQLLRAADEEVRIQAEADASALEEAIADAGAALPDAERSARQRLDASFVAARHAREAEDVAQSAEEALKTANRGSAPITVFVSRDDARVQVRQGFHTIFEGTVDIRAAHLPLGTHVMTAAAALEEPTGLRWTSVSVADGANRGSASEALDRITIDPRIAVEIGRRMWAGATFLVSDRPASRETGKGTDFVILTK